MALLDVVFRLLNKAGDDFVEPRREDGHGSSLANPTFVQTELDTKPVNSQVVATDLATVTQTVIHGLTAQGNYLDVKVNPSGSLTVDATDSIITIANQVDQPLTDTQLRANPVEVTGNLTVAPVALQQVADDYQTGEILPDQTGANNVLTFTFASPVQNVWVYAVNPLDLAEAGEVRVDPFGGNPSATRGIPVGYGGITPIPTTTGSLKVFAPLGARVTVYGNRRA